ncbi:MAG: hypothetical protein HQ567_13440 [Candidatus Nealsonbacteria bacterium]|nr:hypothetical protein [Candidatus Nealsonbacteria bacterium]
MFRMNGPLSALICTALICTALICTMPGCGSDGPKPLPQSQRDSLMTAQSLDDSLDVGRQFLVNIQRPEGNFFYELNLVTGEIKDTDNAVRQAGTLWSVALMHQHTPGDDTRTAVERGLAFFDKVSRTTDDGGTYIVYPGRPASATGTVALVTLTLIELLHAEPEHPNAASYRQRVDEQIRFLLSLRQKEGLFSGGFDAKTGRGTSEPSPFYDGETLLALSKAANYLDRDDLEPILVESADAMYRAYFVKSLKDDPKKETAVQFYQWGSMAMLEIYKTGCKGSEQCADRAIEMALWKAGRLSDTPKYNASHAYEGLASAWEIARLSGNKEAQKTIGEKIESGVPILLTWQVGGPAPNQFLRDNPPKDKKAIGGVMSGPEDPLLRIDVTQHQMHALLLVRRYVLGDE